MMKSAHSAAISAMALSLLLSGCAHSVMPVLHQGEMARKSQQVAPLPQTVYEKGSLWSTNQVGSLFEDTRARRVGDLVMVRVVENASGSKDASTDTGRTSDLSTAVGAFFTSPVAGRNIDVGTSNEFSGSGSTDRSGSLSALVAAVVVELLPNGNLVIEGNREIQVNHETQVIRLSGVVRPVDITTDNVVLSSRIADAQISYTGVGVIDEKQRPGWFTRVFDYLTPF
ncbi:MAG: flagellar basal body L-ring protein FlgH [Leptospirillia bacterium]